MTKEQIINFIREEHDRCLYLSAELSDTDEDYDYLDGIYDGRMRSLRKVRHLILELPDDPVPAKEITFKELYKINECWCVESVLTIYKDDSDGVYMSSAQALAKFGDNVVKYFDGNTIYII